MPFDKIIEELIKKAQERGEFDNLPGKGKPIEFSLMMERQKRQRREKWVIEIRLRLARSRVLDSKLSDSGVVCFDKFSLPCYTSDH